MLITTAKLVRTDWGDEFLADEIYETCSEESVIGRVKMVKTDKDICNKGNVVELNVHNYNNKNYIIMEVQEL